MYFDVLRPRNRDTPADVATAAAGVRLEITSILRFVLLAPASSCLELKPASQRSRCSLKYRWSSLAMKIDGDVSMSDWHIP